MADIIIYQEIYDLSRISNQYALDKITNYLERYQSTTIGQRELSLYRDAGHRIIVTTLMAGTPVGDGYVHDFESVGSLNRSTDLNKTPLSRNPFDPNDNSGRQFGHINIDLTAINDPNLPRADASHLARLASFSGGGSPLLTYPAIGQNGVIVERYASIDHAFLHETGHQLGLSDQITYSVDPNYWPTDRATIDNIHTEQLNILVNIGVPPSFIKGTCYNCARENFLLSELFPGTPLRAAYEIPEGAVLVPAAPYSGQFRARNPRFSSGRIWTDLRAASNASIFGDQSQMARGGAIRIPNQEGGGPDQLYWSTTRIVSRRPTAAERASNPSLLEVTTVEAILVRIDTNGPVAYLGSDGVPRFEDGTPVPPDVDGIISVNLIDLRSPEERSSNPAPSTGTPLGNGFTAGLSTLAATVLTPAIHVENPILASIVNSAVRTATDQIARDIATAFGFDVASVPEFTDRLSHGVTAGVRATIVNLVATRVLDLIGIEGVAADAISGVASQTAINFFTKTVVSAGVSRGVTIGEAFGGVSGPQGFPGAIETAGPVILANVFVNDVLKINNPVATAAGNIASAIVIAAELGGPWVAAAALVVTTILFDVIGIGPNPSVGPVGNVDLAIENGRFVAGRMSTDRNGFKGPDEQLTLPALMAMELALAVLNEALAAAGASVVRLNGFTAITNYALTNRLHVIVNTPGVPDRDSSHPGIERFPAHQRLDAARSFTQRVLRGAILQERPGSDPTVMRALRRGWVDWAIQGGRNPDFRATIPSTQEYWDLIEWIDHVRSLIARPRRLSPLASGPLGTRAQILAGCIQLVRTTLGLVLDDANPQSSSGPIPVPQGEPPDALQSAEQLVDTLVILGETWGFTISRLYDVSAAGGAQPWAIMRQIAGWRNYANGITAESIAASLPLAGPPRPDLTVDPQVRADGTGDFGIRVTWPPLEPGESLDVRWQQDGDAWTGQSVPGGATMVRLSPVAPGRLYRVEVQRVSGPRRSAWSNPVSIAVTYIGQPPRVARLRLDEDAADLWMRNEFVGGDINLEWEDTFPRLEERLPGTVGQNRPRSPWFKHFRVEVLHPDTRALLKFYEENDGWFPLTFQENASLPGGPYRRLVFRVAAVDQLGRQSDWEEIVVSNPVPAQVAVDARGVQGQIAVTLSPSSDLDFDGYAVWCLPAGASAIAETTPVAWFGHATEVQLPRPGGGTWHVWAAATDRFVPKVSRPSPQGELRPHVDPSLVLLAGPVVVTVPEAAGVELRGEGLTFRIGADGQATPTELPLTAHVRGQLGGSFAWSVVGATTQTASVIGQTLTVLASEMTEDRATVTVTYTVAGRSFTDTASVVRVRDGAAALSAVLTNEHHGVPASADGTLLSGALGGAQTRLLVFEGAQDVTDQFTITYQAVGCTVASLLSDDGSRVVGVSVTGMAADAAHVDLIGTRGIQSVTQRFTLAKQRQGVAGPAGTPGTPGSNGSNGASVSLEYSADGNTNWTTSFNASTTVWARERQVSGSGLVTHGTAFRIVGQTGQAGSDGQRGSRQFYVSGQNSWSDAVADSAAGTPKIPGDTVTQYNSVNFAQTKTWSGSSWSTIVQVIDGSLLVDGTVAATAIAAPTLSAITANLGTVNSGLINVGTGKVSLSGDLIGLARVGVIAVDGNTAIHGVGDGTCPTGVVGTCALGTGVQGYGGIYNFYASGPGADYGTFTGGHDILLPLADPAQPGDIIVDTGIVRRVRLSHVLTAGAVSTQAEAPAAIGVMCWRKTLADWIPGALRVSDDDPTLDPSFAAYAATHHAASVLAVGEGQINVCGEGGDIQPGDLIVTSSMPGKGMRQSDDIVRSKTVAKAREGASFASPTEVKMIACIYLCG